MTVPSPATRTGATLSSIPPPNTQTPASLACWATACVSRPTSSHSSAATSIARLGNEIRYLVIHGLLGCTDLRPEDRPGLPPEIIGRRARVNGSRSPACPRTTRTSRDRMHPRSPAPGLSADPRSDRLMSRARLIGDPCRLDVRAGVTRLRWAAATARPPRIPGVDTERVLRRSVADADSTSSPSLRPNGRSGAGRVGRAVHDL